MSGIKGGKLMCETRRDLRSARTQYKTTKPTDEPIVSMPKSVAPPTRTPRVKTQAPREEGDNWTYVSKAKKTEKPLRRSTSSKV